MLDETPVFKNKRITAVIPCAVLIAAAIFAYEIYVPHSAVREPREVTIVKGMGSRAIGALLKQEGIIRSKWAFVAYVSLRGEATLLKSGQYVFFDGATISDIARDLVSGVARERIVLIPEGWRATDIAWYFDEQGIGDAASALRVFVAPPLELTARFSFLADRPRDAGLEGYLFPDTYRVFADASSEDVVVKMLDNFDRKLTPGLRAEIARQKKTIFEIITMASLIEKEVVSDEDRAFVSGILWKRLDAGIPLQVDATVNYIKKQKPKIKNNTTVKITIEDTRIDSPYNTYRHRALPPGPIANPGLSAIRAAIYPKASPYLYYLSAPDGRTIFSRTLDEHNTAKARYLR